MIDSLLVAASAQALEDLFSENDIAYEFRDDDERDIFRDIWDKADQKDKDQALRQANPAIRRIASREPFIFMKDGDPIRVRFNYLKRKLDEDSFGEIMLERPDLDWRFSFSIKNSANVLSSMTVADRDTATYENHDVNVFNEIDDFGDRIFGVPCSNEYFNDINSILQRIAPLDKHTWAKLLDDEEFAYERLITPMLKAIGAEIPRICRDHPEAPEKLFNFFYGKIDYYFLKPIEELQITRIGAVNSHGGLGRIPDNHNHTTPVVDFPTKLLDVRLATGKYGELSRDTIQLTFDSGWSVCINLSIDTTSPHGRNFALNVYLPVTPFGSYRDQVKWDPEA